MPTASFTIDTPTVSRRMHDVQVHWSPWQRNQRAAQARRRMQEFLSLIEESDGEPEIWTVGAPTDTDLQRLAWQH